MPAFIVMDWTEQTFPAVSDLMTMLIVMICVVSQQAGTTVSNFVTVLIIVIRTASQDALTAEDLFYAHTSPPLLTA